MDIPALKVHPIKWPNFGIYCIGGCYERERAVGRYPILKGNTNSKFPGRTLQSSVLSLFPKSPQEKTTEQKSDDAARASIVRTSELKEETFLRLK